MIQYNRVVIVSYFGGGIFTFFRFLLWLSLLVLLSSWFFHKIITNGTTTGVHLDVLWGYLSYTKRLPRGDDIVVGGIVVVIFLLYMLLLFFSSLLRQFSAITWWDMKTSQLITIWIQMHCESVAFCGDYCWLLYSSVVVIDYYYHYCSVRPTTHCSTVLIPEGIVISNTE